MESDVCEKVLTLSKFEALFREHYSSLYRYVYSIVKDEDLAKDVLSELFLTIWLQRDKLQITSYKAYLFRSARNGALKAMKSSSTFEKLPDNVFDIPEDAYTPFERFVSKQSIKIVEELISKLPPKRQEILELRLLGLKNHEIASALDISEKKVEYNLRESIESLSFHIKNSCLDKLTLAEGLMLLNIILINL